MSKKKLIQKGQKYLNDEYNLFIFYTIKKKTFLRSSLRNSVLNNRYMFSNHTVKEIKENSITYIDSSGCMYTFKLFINLFF